MSPKVKFVFDKEKDLYNIWQTCNKGNMFAPDLKKSLNSETVSICENKKFEDCREVLEKKFDGMYASKLIPIIVKSANDSWKTVNDEFFRRLKKVMKKPIYRQSFTGYLTTMPRCPYNLGDNSFMFGFFSSIPQIMATAGHEIMHLQFHNTYWNEVEKEIGNKKTSDLKEALTVLLNIEFRGLWYAPDKGYEMHKELRDFIAKEWEKKKDFDILMKKCLNYLKKANP